ncbi:MAG TPA: family 16 glycoside hydrolase [Burkholderiales bacterium]|jgi:hypothetical protein|nr:family 16 glycoside hydrolase [Burkholderiales bacterium]
MKRLLVAVAMVANCSLSQAASESFDTLVVGVAPAGWQCGVSGRGDPKWLVEPDETAPSKPNVLRQSGQGTFPWCAKNDTSLVNGFVEVKFQSIAGREDQAGGVVWRFTGPRSYYVARANAMENNVSLYYMWLGLRRAIQYADAPVPAGQWNVLRVEFEGEQIKVLLNGKTYIDVRDGHIAGAGQVGVWTKADSVTAFDDFSYGESE